MALVMIGKWRFTVTRDDKVLLQREGCNLVTLAGEQQAAARFGPTGPPAAVDWIAFGTGTTTPTKSDTTLGAEIGGTRTASASAVASDGELTYTFQYTAGGPITIDEAGLFNDAVAGIMASRFLTQTFSMGAGDVLDLTYVLEFLGVD